MLIIIIVFIISNLSFVQSSHFLGGTISWKPMNNMNTGSIIPVMFTQSYQWIESATGCNQSLIYNLPSVPSQPDILTCVSNSSLCGGFSSLATKGYCIDSSTSLDSRSTQISDIENIMAGSKFCIAFQSIHWRTIRSPSCNFTCNTATAKWSIGSCVDLTVRPEGFINTSPVATIISPIRVPINSTINIVIPVIDADNDVVRCRWAQNTSTFDECRDICGIIPGSTLDSDTCTLTFDSTGKTVGDYYAVALMVEDFSNTSMNTSLSSVPIQFLIEIGNASSCLSKPMISSNVSNCTAIYVGVQFNFTLIITSGCLNTTIVDLFTMSPLNMFQNNLTQIGTNNTWNIIQTWMPTIEQLGPQVYCVVAMNSNGIQSDQYCLKFNVVPAGRALLCPSEALANMTAIISKSLRINNITTASTTAPARTVIETVLVPDTSNTNYQFSDLDLALGLGLSLPLLLLVGGFIFCKCCCKQCKCFSSLFTRRDNRSKTTSNNNQSESIQKSVKDIKENKDLKNQLPDYRQQYVNDGHKPHTNKRTKVLNEKRLLTFEKPLTSKPSNDFEQNSMNITKTTFLSPSLNSFATINNVQITEDSLLKTKKTTNHGSVLVRAFHNQENQKSVVHESRWDID